jgi:hypothetical protein
MPQNSDPARDTSTSHSPMQVHESAAVSATLLGSWIAQSTRRAGWLPIVVFGFHTAATAGWNAYHKIPNLDVPMHVVGGIAIAYFFWHSLHTHAARQLLGAPSRFALQLLALTATGATTGLWEFAEWTTDSLGWTHAQGGVDDTMLDMFLGMLGGLAVVLWVGFRPRLK